jgi:hypothetical protein
LASGVYSVIIWIGKTDPVSLSQPFSAEVRGVIYKRNQQYKIWQPEVLHSLDTVPRIRTKGLDMYRYKIIVIAMFLCILPKMQTQAQSEDDVAINNNGTPTIAVAKLDITDKNLKLSYEIRNDSEQDIWICEDINRNRMTHFEVYLDEDAQTLMIRRRLDVPLIPYVNQPFGCYVRLPTNESRTESLLIPLPVHRRTLFSGSGLIKDTVYAVSLLLEIGYYIGDLPGMIRGVLEKAERKTDKNTDKELARIKKYMGGLLYFNERNESLSQRDEQVIVAYTWQALKGERVLSTKIDGQRIPYIGRDRYPGFRPPDIRACTRLEIRYKPSMLEYFFPYDGQQRLLSLEEKRYLQSEKLIVVDEPEELKALASEVSNQINSIGGIVCERSKAHVVCYCDDEMLNSFTVYDDTTIETEQKKRIKYRRVLQSLRKLTPHIQPLELRMQCAANLRDLWHRLRLYQRAAKSLRIGLFRRRVDKPYPEAKKWCDYMVWACNSIGMLDKFVMRQHKCPGAGEGKCHYALNPNCKYESPPDTVLLFETKAGWNQHGGPELFTFDNHDPKGGCVLLNDGTVKFIHTKEELQQLRWK